MSSTTLYGAAPGSFALVEQGMLLPLTIAGPRGVVTTTAQVDTGSTISSVDSALLQQIGAPVVGNVEITTVEGSSIVPAYKVTLDVQGFPLAPTAVDVLGDSLPAPVQALIGRDDLSLYRLTYNGALGTWEIDAQRPIPRPSSATWMLLGAAGLAAVSGIALYNAEKTKALAERIARRVRRR